MPPSPFDRPRRRRPAPHSPDRRQLCPRHRLNALANVPSGAGTTPPRLRLPAAKTSGPKPPSKHPPAPDHQAPRPVRFTQPKATASPPPAPAAAPPGRRGPTDRESRRSSWTASGSSHPLIEQSRQEWTASARARHRRADRKAPARQEPGPGAFRRALRHRFFWRLAATATWKVVLSPPARPSGGAGLGRVPPEH